MWTWTFALALTSIPSNPFHFVVGEMWGKILAILNVKGKDVARRCKSSLLTFESIYMPNGSGTLRGLNNKFPFPMIASSSPYLGLVQIFLFQNNGSFFLLVLGWGGSQLLSPITSIKNTIFSFPVLATTTKKETHKSSEICFPMHWLNNRQPILCWRIATMITRNPHRCCLSLYMMASIGCKWDLKLRWREW